jgi:chromate transport protein ChrA
MGAMLKRPFGIVLLAGALLVASIVGIAAFWAVLPRTSDTSPLAALFALIWSCTYFVTATLTWRRSRFAPLSFLAAIGLLLFPASFIFPAGQLVFPSFMVIVLVAVLGYLYLRTARQPSPSGR